MNQDARIKKFMKTLKIFILALLIYPFYSPFNHASDILSTIHTGLTVLDVALNEFNVRSQTVDGTRAVINEISTSFNLTNAYINMLHQQGYSYDQIYYLGLLSKQSGLTVDELVKKKSKGIGWGELAHSLGIHPSELNKARVALKKEEKTKKDNPGKGKGNSKDNPGKGKAKGKNK